MKNNIFIFLILTLFCTVASKAAEIKATYDFVWGGMTLATSETRLTQDQTTYSAEIETRTRGILKLFSPGRGTVRVDGSMLDRSMQPQTYTSFGRWDGKNYTRTVTFGADGRMTDLSQDWPEKWTRDFTREDVPEDMRVGPDPMTAILSILTGTTNKAPQEPYVMRMFEGQEVNEVTFQCAQNQEDLKKVKKSAYAGAADRCGIDVTTLAGHVIETEKQRKKREKREEKHVSAPKDSRSAARGSKKKRKNNW